LSTPSGEIPVVDTVLRKSDILGSWLARWGVGRMRYRVEPGLYAVGSPTPESHVFVSANYKMSFDRLRSELEGIDGWILVLDTKGINVWCAAGKGTFGTDEIVRRINQVGLKDIVRHHRLIIPQLAASGVSAHEVRKHAGYHVFYGPVRAHDIKAYLEAGRKTTPEMRGVTFTFSERVVLIPIDVVRNLKYGIPASAILVLLSGLGHGVYSFDNVASYWGMNAAIPLLTVFAGAILPAALLPWLPGRAFSIKGAFAGLLPIIAVALLAFYRPQLFHSMISAISWFILIPAVTSFIGMNFTGSSTYTSLSGVKREMRIALPAQIVCAALGIGLWLIGLFL
jgi:hypothetical protein